MKNKNINRAFFRKGKPVVAGRRRREGEWWYIMLSKYIA
jgi:hypothetical protein